MITLFFYYLLYYLIDVDQLFVLAIFCCKEAVRFYCANKFCQHEAMSPSLNVGKAKFTQTTDCTDLHTLPRD